MAILRTLILVIVAGALLGSCSRQAILLLVNNTGGAIEVLRVSLGQSRENALSKSFWESLFGRPFSIENGKSRELPQATWELENRYWRIAVRADECLLRFTVPFDVGDVYQRSQWRDWIGEGYHSFDPTVQLERDHSLFLVAAGASQAQGLSPFREIQPDGFPLAPDEQVCEDTGDAS